MGAFDQAAMREVVRGDRGLARGDGRDRLPPGRAAGGGGVGGPFASAAGNGGKGLLSLTG